jgi:hypothetical protein
MISVTLYPYPKLRITSKRSMDHGQLVLRWMSRNALRYLRQVELAGMPQPSTDELAAWLIENSDAADEHFDSADIATKCAAGAEFALDVYDSRYYDRQARAGARGGAAGAIEISDEDLLRVRDLSHNEAARALNVSRSTVIRRRHEFDRPEVLIPLPVEILEMSEGNETVTGWPPATTADLPLLFRSEIEADRAERLYGLDLLAGIEVL